MVTHFVQEGAKKSPEGNHLAAFGRAHPHLNVIVLAAAVILGVEAVEFSTTVRGPHAFNLHAHGAHPESPANVIHNRLRERSDLWMIVST